MMFVQGQTRCVHLSGMQQRALSQWGQVCYGAASFWAGISLPKQAILLDPASRPHVCS